MELDSVIISYIFISILIFKTAQLQESKHLSLNIFSNSDFLVCFFSFNHRSLVVIFKFTTLPANLKGRCGVWPVLNWRCTCPCMQIYTCKFCKWLFSSIVSKKCRLDELKAITEIWFWGVCTGSSLRPITFANNVDVLLPVS